MHLYIAKIAKISKYISTTEIFFINNKKSTLLFKLTK